MTLDPRDKKVVALLRSRNPRVRAATLAKLLGVKLSAVIEYLEGAGLPTLDVVPKAFRKEYLTWYNMISRCYVPGSPGYENYGGRGITVCDRWRVDFPNFLDDMGPRPEGCSIDRINPYGNYEPSNCRWLQNALQNKNKRPDGKRFASEQYAKWGAEGGKQAATKRAETRPTTRAEAERIWFDSRIKTVEEAAERAGWHWRTMYRSFGARGVSVGRPRKIEELAPTRKSKIKRKTKRKAKL